MKIIFMGTPEFALPSLEKIFNSHHEITAVVTGPDKPTGRGQKLKSTPIKKAAENYGVPILTPTKLSDHQFVEELKSIQADLFVVVAFRILPSSVFKIPAKGTINLHSSLLPKYRGAAPINWAIINGDKESGTTTFFIDEKVDTGEWILQKKEQIFEDDNAGDLHDRLSISGANLLLESINLIEQGKAPKITQTGEVTKAPKLTKELCRIDWDKDVVAINNLIRGLAPFPRAYTSLNNKEMKILRSIVVSTEKSIQGTPGEIIGVEKDKILVATKNGVLALVELQPENKRKMSTAEYLRGHSVAVGEKFI